MQLRWNLPTQNGEVPLTDMKDLAGVVEDFDLT